MPAPHKTFLHLRRTVVRFGVSLLVSCLGVTAQTQHGLGNRIPGGNVAYNSGTSVAASQLAGALALVLSARPSLQGRPEQMWRLIGTVPALPTAPGACGSPDAWPNFTYGWGSLDVSAMLSMANTN